jgi:acetylornithine/succinyldiaminopimelate/putrescine aminotransferase
MMHSLSYNPILGHITTFGGHPVSAAASLATLELILEEKLHEKVEKKAQLFKELLVHPKIKNLRQEGFLMALEFENFDQNKRIIDAAIERGIITDWFLFCDNSLRIAPPLVIDEEQIREACEKIIACIDAYA